MLSQAVFAHVMKFAHENLKRKQEAWKLQVQNSKRKKVNQPVVAPVEEDDEKQQVEEENQNDQSAALEQVDSQIAIYNEMVENHKQDEDALSDFEDIFEPKRKENDKEYQYLHLDNLADFLDGFDDDELEHLLWDTFIWYFLRLKFL